MILYHWWFKKDYINILAQEGKIKSQLCLQDEMAYDHWFTTLKAIRTRHTQIYHNTLVYHPCNFPTHF